MTDNTNNTNRNTHKEHADEQADDEGGLTLLQLIGSALAAGFGVQSSANRKRDFAKGKPSQFIAIGIIFTVLFVLIMVGVVNLVLSAVGA